MRTIKKKFGSRNSKTNAIVAHAKRRFLERHDRLLTDEEYIRICNIIKKNRPGKYLVEVQSNRVRVWQLDISSVIGYQMIVRVVYDCFRHLIVSFLPIPEILRLNKMHREFDAIDLSLLEVNKELDRLELVYDNIESRLEALERMYDTVPQYRCPD